MKIFQALSRFRPHKGACIRWLSLAILLALPAMAEPSERLYRAPDFEVTFPEGGYAAKPLPDTETAGYFRQYDLHIKFCRQPALPPHVQQVRSEDGWLCSFYRLPPLGAGAARAEILARKPEQTTISYAKAEGIGTEAHQDLPMLVWREQSGKTRLDHFLVLGPRHNYLFVSSPYGDGDRIREVLRTLRLN